MRVCKMFRFDAAHYLPNYEGKCKNLHGHTWTLEVEVSSDKLIQLGSEAGMVVDFGKLKEAVNREVISELDHTLLNDTIENPTCENLLEWIWKALFPWSIHEGGVVLERLRLYETPDSFAEMRRDAKEKQT